MSETDADTIETFLDARAADNAAFDFTPPGEGSSSKFVCETWSKSIPYETAPQFKQHSVKSLNRNGSNSLGSSTAFSVGDIRRASTEQASGFWFKCIVAGTSGSSEPDWPNSLFRVDSTVDVNNADEVAANCLIIHNNQCVSAGVVVDGTVTWKAIASAHEELAKINPSAIIELFELRLDSTLHGSSDVIRFLMQAPTLMLMATSFSTVKVIRGFRSRLMVLSIRTLERCLVQP